jgi:hypothetical protein
MSNYEIFITVVALTLSFSAFLFQFIKVIKKEVRDAMKENKL